MFNGEHPMMRDPKRQHYIEIANDTLQILQDGKYVNVNGEEVFIKDSLESAVSRSVLYTPVMTDRLEFDAKRVIETKSSHNTVYEVTTETSLEAIQRLLDEGEQKVLCLNFASARTPGGGFKKGASAQEETIARSSGLFPCISQMRDMYDHNRQVFTGFYSDHMIYSPDVPLFKNDEGKLHDKPYYSSFITAPAVNAGVVKDKAWSDSHLILDVMKSRIAKILSLAIVYNHEVLILGAFGCGVFKNEPDDIARIFKELLSEERFRQAFKKILFAVYDPTPTKENYTPFKNRF